MQRRDDEGVPPPPTRCGRSRCCRCCRKTRRAVGGLVAAASQDPHVVRLLDLKQGVNKEGQTILYLVFEYMDTDLKKFIRGHHANHEKIPALTVKVFMPI
ncbi:cyclin-dependent kinase B2-1 [Panicum miliaceum]|uniref:Cyclin-dependent kinase B2-1 n=1 Tax=Panicum miliaceum TaxID=4540 RepID=A0A3L6TGA4_PANMI|nr:cyclin-dependent kinase B2-1 [Panicum miliaceum]